MVVTTGQHKQVPSYSPLMSSSEHAACACASRLRITSHPSWINWDTQKYSAKKASVSLASLTYLSSRYSIPPYNILRCISMTEFMYGAKPACGIRPNQYVHPAVARTSAPYMPNCAQVKRPPRTRSPELMLNVGATPAIIQHVLLSRLALRLWL